MAKGVQAILGDMGIQGKITALGKVPELHTDSSAAKGMANRKGLGKVRHIEVSQLWVQQEVAAGRVKVIKG